MQLGVALSQNDSWHFFQDIYDDFKSHYQVEVFQYQQTKLPFFQERINKRNFRNKLSRFLKSKDVVFFEWASGLLAAATQLPKEGKIVTRLHSFELYEWASKIKWDNVDKVILVSNAMQQRFCNLYPEQSHKSIVIYNGIPLEKFKPLMPHEFHWKLGMVSSIAPIKRIYEVVLLLYSLHVHGVNASLHIAGKPTGDFRYFAAIQRIVDELGLNQNVTFDGFITDIPNWLQNIDIFISNSFWEGQQTALLEAMATGVYCLSHNWAGADEILPLENLYFTEEEVVRKIKEYSHFSDVEKQRMGDLMRTIACEKFDAKQTKMKIRQVIDEIGLL